MMTQYTDKIIVSAPFIGPGVIAEVTLHGEPMTLKGGELVITCKDRHPITFERLDTE